MRDLPRAVPPTPFGANANMSAMLAVCPHGEFISCFGADLQRRYKVHALFKPRELPWREPVQNAQRVFSRLGRNCTAAPPPPPPPSSLPSPASLLGFAYAALAISDDLHASVGKGGPAPLPASRRAALQTLQAAAAAAARRAPRLSCASRSVDLDSQLLMMIGVPSGTTGRSAERRHEARTTWMTSPQVGTSVGVCFLLSAYGELPPRGEGWAAEAEENGDVLLLQVAETRQLLAANTRYSNYTKHGRGMPTFKQFAFFRHAATLLPHVSYIGKIDDDTAVNLRLLVPILQLARCLPNVLLGSVQWSAF